MPRRVFSAMQPPDATLHCPGGCGRAHGSFNPQDESLAPIRPILFHVLGLQLVLPPWFQAAVMAPSKLLVIDQTFTHLAESITDCPSSILETSI